MKLKNGKYKMIAMPINLAIVIIISICAPIPLLMIIFMPDGIRQANESIWIWIFVIFFCILSIICIVFCFRESFGVVEMDEKGVTYSLFGKFKKLSIEWDNIAEIIYKPTTVPIIYISGSVPIYSLSLGKIRKRMRKHKDVFSILFTKERYAVIKKYIKCPIHGLTKSFLIAMGYETPENDNGSEG